MRYGLARGAIGLIITLAGLLILSSCAPGYRGEEASAPPIELDGSYQGTYWITHHDGSSEQFRESGHVWMSFAGGHYQVQGAQPYLPPAGSGDYRIEDGILQLEDTANHTAEFDWTLILQGRFEIHAGDGGYLRLEQRDLEHSRLHELELRKDD